MKRSEKGRGLFYHRDSGGKHETTPPVYVSSAQREFVNLGVTFSGTPDAMTQLMRDRSVVKGDLILDYDVMGNQLDRPGLRALFEMITADATISHVFIPRRDRLARPDYPYEGVEIETRLRRLGVTLIFFGKTVPPLRKGHRQDLAEGLSTYLDYDRSGRDRTELAQKIIHSKIQLAVLGHWTGGRAPFALRRALARADGTIVRLLQDGERVRMEGHYVVLVVGPDDEVAIVLRIFELAIMRIGPSRIAQVLNSEGIPSPDAGRTKRNAAGVHVPVRGCWNATTVSNILWRPEYGGTLSFGLRSMGDQLRFTKDGPRQLDDADYRIDGKPKVIRNPESARITAPAGFEPIVDQATREAALAFVATLGTTQRGKPRSRDPNRNPLGSRVFDMNCGWTMYRQPHNGSFRYVCSKYDQIRTQPRQCQHNHVEGPRATKLVLACIQQRLCDTSLRERIRQRLEEFANNAVVPNKSPAEAMRRRLQEILRLQSLAEGNLAFANNKSRYDAIDRQITALEEEKQELEQRLQDCSEVLRQFDPRREVDLAMRLLDRLPDILASDPNLGHATQAITLANARLFLRFKQVQNSKRTINVVAGGAVTMGTAEPPVEIYQGPTARDKITQAMAAAVAAEPAEGNTPSVPELIGEEGESLGNRNRGDMI